MALLDGMRSREHAGSKARLNRFSGLSAETVPVERGRNEMLTAKEQSTYMYPSPSARLQQHSQRLKMSPSSLNNALRSIKGKLSKNDGNDGRAQPLRWRSAKNES